MIIYVGIDPGLDGAAAFIRDDGDLIGIYDTPFIVVKSGKKNHSDYAPQLMAHIFQEEENIAVLGNRNIHVGLEAVHSMPEQGVSSSFLFGRGFGIWEGILAALDIPYTKVSPQRWKKIMLTDMGKSKDAARVRALQLFPKADLSLKKHHGRAEALLIAEYVRRLDHASTKIANIVWEGEITP